VKRSMNLYAGFECEKQAGSLRSPSEGAQRTRLV
jgi:hypothetical protein